MKTPLAVHRSRNIVIALGIAIVIVIAGVSVGFYIRSTSLMQEQLRTLLSSTAAATAATIDGDMLDRIQGPDDMERPDYASLVQTLLTAKRSVPHVRFAYVLRTTEDPETLAFVADADALSPLEDVDTNGNGTIDGDEEPSYPGELYEIDEAPAMRDAFVGPTADREITVDQWGRLMSGYAPIRSKSTGRVVAILGFDMQADDFVRLSRGVLSPFALIVTVLAAGLLIGGIILLSESRQIEFLHRMNAERSGLLQLTFHQLGEPITIIQWGLETLEGAQSDAEMRKLLPQTLADMRDGAHRLSAIIDTLQEAERVELGTLENKPVMRSMRDALHEIIASFDAQIATTKHRIDLDAPDDAFAFDPHLLGIVVRLLIENSIDYSKPGSTIFVQARRERHAVRVGVSDEGCGIPPAELPSLFEKYHRASNAVLVKPDGNGLGLYIAKGVVDLMGGAIGAESKVGKGTRIWFTIPLDLKRQKA